MQPQTVLFVASSLEYSGAARQLCLLAAGLPRESFRVCVAVLGTQAPWVESLRGAGVEVQVLGWRRPFDVVPFVTLRRLVKSQRPDVVHAWGSTALRVVTLSGSRGFGRLMVSAALPFASRAGLLDRWMLAHVGEAIAFGNTEAERYRRLRIPPNRLTVVFPATPPLPLSEGGGGNGGGKINLAEFPGVRSNDRVIVGMGPIVQHKGFREAVWAFDIVRYLYDDVHLALIGEGPDRLRVERFARHLGLGESVHFLGKCDETAPFLYRADIVWVPSLHGGGVCSALEAMAVGRPVIASRLPELAEIVVDGETGFLVEPNDKAALARRTRLLLDDPQKRQEMGAAGRHRVREHYTVDRLVIACARRYAEAKKLV